MTVAAGVSFAHLLAMSDEIGTFEHALLAEPRHHHGYCTDDVARVAIAVAREPHPSAAVSALGERSMAFLVSAQHPRGTVRNRRAVGGRWIGPASAEDCWGRSVWAFGTVAVRASSVAARDQALAHFERGMMLRPESPRSVAYAALGAAEVLSVHREHVGARTLLADAVLAIGPLGREPGWPWPEPRLAYGNATFAEVLIAAGHLLHRPAVLVDGLTLLTWLLARETIDVPGRAGHLSTTPVGGSGPGWVAPAFDQQPIEVAAMADACARAFAVTGDETWGAALDRAVAWFDGDNDAGTPMWDPATGGGYDGLEATGPNLNQGAESTLALVTTWQHRRSGGPRR